MSDNIVDTFFARQQGHGAKPAIVWNGETVCTFAELPAHVGRYRAALAQLGVTRGERVMVKTENSPAFVFTYLAVLASGAIFVPMNAAYTAAEVELLVEDADPPSPVSTAWLAKRAMVDARFPDFVALAGCPIWIAGPGACRDAEALLAGGRVPGARVTSMRGA